ncbi:hypothetical protein D7M11_26985 [Paenibacillus ginsengarvi]|uniref:Uncharacterized protein n=1 Tax=Paenibacillus ginsengarvi TaxID=400777 RepID=A0A3B0BR95_9BACL|nr:hypothetical protein D7M11_26985 [Paenibacillus ginsengarvi]
MDKNRQLVVFIIEGSTIRKFIILDIIIGSGIFYMVKFLVSSIWIAWVSSFLGTEGIKRVSRLLKNKRKMK